jgi:hypothetical protein
MARPQCDIPLFFCDTWWIPVSCKGKHKSGCIPLMPALHIGNFLGYNMPSNHPAKFDVGLLCIG